MDDRDSDPTLPWGMGMLPKNSAGGKVSIFDAVSYLLNDLDF